MSDEDALKLLPMLSLEESSSVEEVIMEHQKRPELHVAQKNLAKAVTKLIHGSELTEEAEILSQMLFERTFTAARLSNPENILSSTRLRLFSAIQHQRNITAIAFLTAIFPEHSKSKMISSPMYKSIFYLRPFEKND